MYSAMILSVVSERLRLMRSVSEAMATEYKGLSEGNADDERFYIKVWNHLIPKLYMYQTQILLHPNSFTSAPLRTRYNFN